MGTEIEDNAMAEESSELSAAAKNLISTFEYLLELDRRRRRPVFQLSEHKLLAFHECQIVGLSEVETNLIDGDLDVWLRIPRLKPERPPNPDEMLQPGHYSQ